MEKEKRMIIYSKCLIVVVTKNAIGVNNMPIKSKEGLIKTINSFNN